MRIICCCFFLLLSFVAIAQQDKVNAYVEKYKDLAIVEMQRTGVPAAITLAQGILESGYGESELCKNSNNHFGIKCKVDWIGEKVYADDDESNECFRKYPDPLSSYKDHSDFLKSRPHYAFLFNLEPTDFESWAHGLKKAGYATERTYAERLIGLIKNYNLNSYTYLALDKSYTPKISWALNEASVQDLTKKTIATTIVADEKAVALPKNNNIKLKEINTTVSLEIFEINDTKVIQANAGTSLLAIAQTHNISLKRLIEYNELNNFEVLENDQLIFLERKPKKGNKDFHIVAAGESLYNIAQKEGIRLEYLAEYNGLNKSIYPLAGETIYLRTKAPITPKFSIASTINNSTSTIN